MLKCVENCGPRHQSKRMPLARCQKIFKFTLYINFFKKPNIKIYYIYFLILYYLLAQKKKGNWKIAQGCRLYPTFLIPLNSFHKISAIRSTSSCATSIVNASLIYRNIQVSDGVESEWFYEQSACTYNLAWYFLMCQYRENVHREDCMPA